MHTALYKELKTQFKEEGAKYMTPQELYYLFKHTTKNEGIFTNALAKKLVGSEKMNEIKFLYQYDPTMMTHNQLQKLYQQTDDITQQEELNELIHTKLEQKNEISKFQELFSQHLGELVKMIFIDGNGNKHNKFFKVTEETIYNMQNYLQYDELKGIGVSDGKGSTMYLFGEPQFIKQKSKQEVRRSGGFFPYQPKNEMPRKIRLLIKDFIIDNPVPCLFEAISQNLIDLNQEDKISSFKQTLSCDFTKIESIKKLCTPEFGFQIRDYNHDKTRMTYYDNEQETILQIGYFQQHYFYDRPLYMNELEVLSEFEYTFKNKELKTIGSLIKRLFNDDLFEPKRYTYEDVVERYEQKNEIKDVEGDISDLQKLFTPKLKEEIDELIVVADTETITTNDDGTVAKVHKCYLICCVSEYGKKSFTEIDDFMRYLHNLQKETDRHLNVYFHNLSYDIGQFIMSGRIISRTLSVDGKMISCLVDGILFRDSLKIINAKASDMASMFGLKIKKEVFPYTYYTNKNLSQKYCLLSDAQKHLKTDEEKQEFEKNCDELQLTKIVKGKKYFDILAYSKFYCIQDCEIVFQSMNMFRNQLQEHFDLDLINFNSISSLSMEYFRLQGCYQGVYKLTGSVRKFIQQCVIGGRCMTRDNKKWNIKGKICDFDAVSLYPSAMNICYFPSGKCDILNKNEIKHYNKLSNLNKIGTEPEDENQDTLFVRVRLTNPKTKYGFPIMSKKRKSGIRFFENYEEGEYFISHVYLQDAIKYHQFDYEILSGVIFRERNYQIRDTITKLFQWRLKVKQQMKVEKDENKKSGMDALQNIIKLMMNSFYGKNIENVHPTTTDIVGNDELDKYIQDSYSRIKSIDEFDNYSVVQKYGDLEEYSYVQCGVMILDFSKRIMNNVMCLAENIGCKIYYQDTDSMHINQEDINKLSKAYMDEYEKKLIGEEMGQFHSDFSCQYKGFKVNHSKQLIALGKKCYLDVLECQNEKGEIKIDYHIRLKGVSDQAIEYEVNKNFDGKYEDLYQKLYDGETMVFDLCKGKVVFKKDKLFQHNTLETFIRQIKF